MRTFPLSVVAVDRVGYAQDAVACTLATTTGWRTFEARHEPFAAVLKPGPVFIDDENGLRQTIATDGGLVKFDGRQCVVLTLAIRFLDKS